MMLLMTKKTRSQVKTKNKMKISNLPEDKQNEIAERISLAAEKFHPIYVFMKWNWADASTKSGIPTKEDLRRTMRHLISDILESDETTMTGTGGIQITREYIGGEDDNEYLIGIDMNIFGECFDPKGSARMPDEDDE